MDGFGKRSVLRLAHGRCRVIAALVLRETSARFGRSAGGYLWAVIEPLGGVLLLAAAFGVVVHKPPLGSSFEVFYATGLIPFMLYNAVSNGAMNAIPSNRGLLAYPVVTALDTVLARTLLETLTYVVVACLILPTLTYWSGAILEFDAAAFAAALALSAMLGLGIGTLNAVLAGFFPTWRQVWSVVNRPLFLVSGVLFLPEAVPEAFAPLVWANPLTHVIAMMRAAFYGPDAGSFADPVYLAAVALGSFVIGALLMQRHESRLIQAA